MFISILISFVIHLVMLDGYHFPQFLIKSISSQHFYNQYLLKHLKRCKSFNLFNKNNIDEYDDSVSITEDDLKKIWEDRGNSLDEYNQISAIELLDDDDDEDGYTSIKLSTDSSNYSLQNIKSTLQLSSSSSPSSSMKSSTLKSKSVGIDLGTTFSSVSIIEAGIPTIIHIDSSPLVPSVVAYINNSTSPIIGYSAKQQLIINPQNTFSSIKRIIGCTIQQAKDNNEKLLLKRIDSRNSTICQLKCPTLNQQLLLPEEISAEILKYLINKASEYIGSPVTRAVITIPAYFKPSQMKATEKAGYIAGLEKVKLLREPEAAALAYGLNKKRASIVMVLDLGGGTFDVSVLDVGDGVVEVKATSGDNHLGGDDFDDAIVRWIIAQHVSSGGNDPSKNPLQMRRLLEAAENAKKDLSTATKTRIFIPLFEEDKSIDVELSRAKFESLVSKLLTRLLTPIREVAIMAGVNLAGESGEIGFTDEDYVDEIEDITDRSKNSLQKKQLSGKQAAKEKRKVKGTINKEMRRLEKEYSDPSISSFPSGRVLDEVILVGGATRMPCIQRLVKITTGIFAKFSINPDEAVSLGAAVLAGIMDGDITGMEVMSSWQAAMYRAFYEQQLIAESKTAPKETVREDDVIREANKDSKRATIASAATKTPSSDNVKPAVSGVFNVMRMKRLKNSKA